MAVDLAEDLRLWIGEETQAAIFRSLLALEVMGLSVEGISPEMLEAVRAPLRELYELSTEAESSW